MLNIPTLCHISVIDMDGMTEDPLFGSDKRGSDNDSLCLVI